MQIFKIELKESGFGWGDQDSVRGRGATFRRIRRKYVEADAYHFLQLEGLVNSVEGSGFRV